MSVIEVNQDHAYLIAGWLDGHGGSGRLGSYSGSLRIILPRTGLSVRLVRDEERAPRLELLSTDGRLVAVVRLDRIADVTCDSGELYISLDNDDEITVVAA